MPILDTHVHFWDASVLPYPWLTPSRPNEVFFVDVARLPSQYLPADYLAEAAGTTVVPFVHVEAGGLAANSVRETRWLASLGSSGSVGPLLVVAADLSRADLSAVLDEHAEGSPRVVGVREIVTWHRDARFTFVGRDVLMDPGWRRGLRIVEQHGLSFDLQIYPGQGGSAADIAREHPGLRLIVEHAGLPLDFDKDGLASWRAAMQTLADEPNVAIKIGGFAMVRRTWTKNEVIPLVRQLVDMFSPARSMFASNFPVERASHSMQELCAVWMKLWSR